MKGNPGEPPGFHMKLRWILSRHRCRGRAEGLGTVLGIGELARLALTRVEAGFRNSCSPIPGQYVLKGIAFQFILNKKAVKFIVSPLFCYGKFARITFPVSCAG